MALNPFSVIEIDPGGKTMAECLGIDDGFKEKVYKVLRDWEAIPGYKTYSMLCEMITEHCQNPNEVALACAKVFYYLGFYDGKEAGGGWESLLGHARNC
jgi:hypothetical protein